MKKLLPFLLMAALGGEACAQKTTFTPTGQQTGKGYDFLEYEGSVKPFTVERKQEISDLFDRWDQQQGDKCKNTSWRNVRIHNGNIYIVADCELPERPFFSDGKYQRIDYQNPKVKEGIREGRFEKGFLPALEQMCQRLDMHCQGLLSIMDYETRGTFSPRIKNPKGTASGLIQFTAATARSLGTSTQALRRMNQVQQLKYVERYFRRMEKEETDYGNVIDIALTIFYPKAVGRGPGYVIGRRKSTLYRQNRGLDNSPRDGMITSREYTRRALDRGYL